MNVESLFWLDSVGVCFRYCEFMPGLSFEAFVFTSLVFLLTDWWQQHVSEVMCEEEKQRTNATGLSKAHG